MTEEDLVGVVKQAAGIIRRGLTDEERAGGLGASALPAVIEALAERFDASDHAGEPRRVLPRNPTATGAPAWWPSCQRLYGIEESFGEFMRRWFDDYCATVKEIT